MLKDPVCVIGRMFISQKATRNSQQVNEVGGRVKVNVKWIFV